MSVQTLFCQSGANNSAVGTQDWTNPSNVAHLDGNFAFFQKNVLGTLAVDSSIKIVKGGSISGTDHSTGTQWDPNQSTASFGGSSDLWGLSWTAADVNASNFGVALSASMDALQSHYLVCTMGANPFSIPPGSTINGITVVFHRGAINQATSFVAGTMISTSGGAKPIEEVQVGDPVEAFDSDGEVTSRLVTDIRSGVKDHIYEVKTANRTAYATAGHLFYTGQGFRAAEDLLAGDQVFVQCATGGISLETLTGVTLTNRNETVYTLTVDTDHTFFAGGFAVHNTNGLDEADVDAVEISVDYSAPARPRRQTAIKTFVG